VCRAATRRKHGTLQLRQVTDYAHSHPATHGRTHTGTLPLARSCYVSRVLRPGHASPSHVHGHVPAMSVRAPSGRSVHLVMDTSTARAWTRPRRKSHASSGSGQRYCTSHPQLSITRTLRCTAFVGSVGCGRRDHALSRSCTLQRALPKVDMLSARCRCRSRHHGGAVW
jgi:hypothetical protein